MLFPYYVFNSNTSFNSVQKLAPLAPKKKDVSRNSSLINKPTCYYWGYKYLMEVVYDPS